MIHLSRLRLWGRTARLNREALEDREAEVPTYLFAELEITNPTGLEPYRVTVGDTIAQYGGRFIVRAGATRLLEGAATNIRACLQSR